ncbi:hypothetical protein [Mesorhizobium australicum]|uniref:Uncharacterized protein n=1 Tax=Mesorhizobium australicum TaxID=536018 RepID=A0A1X7PUN5_9HYPH|nr:hypothetical protein [Mesorhizobium australicum]SMH55362.1 hypothetical protein SAMN02982922_5328 [Mesorhizobium australicum]
MRKVEFLIAGVRKAERDYLRNIFQDVKRLSQMIPDDLGRWGIP